MSCPPAPRARLVSLILCLSLLINPAVFPAAGASASPGAGAKAGATFNTTAEPAARHAAQAVRREGELLVRFRQGVSEQEVDSLTAILGLERRGRLRGASGVERLAAAAGQDVDSAVAALGSSPLVEFAEPNYLVAADQTAPDDPHFPEQWALRNTGDGGGKAGADIEVTQAWLTTKGSEKTVVAVIDSGVDFTHPDLGGNRWANPAETSNGRDDDGDGFADDLHGWDFVADSAEIKDASGHGTAVAGLIAARGNNGEGVSGVMWRASLMSLRVLDPAGAGDVASAVEAIDYAVARGASVVNASWGTPAESAALREAIARAWRRGVAVVCSAGNGGQDLAQGPRYPASYDLPNVVAVASTDSTDRLGSGSNSGRGVLVAAPGVGLLTAKAGGGYAPVSGTSAAAAVVSGVVGLVKSVRPRLKAVRVREVLLTGARRVEGLAGRVAAGGVVSAAAAVDLAAALPADADLPEGEEEGSEEKSDPAQPSAAAGDDAPEAPPAHPGRPSRRMPDLDEARGHRPAEPRAIPPVPSTLRRCPPQNPRCNEAQEGPPQPTPTPAPTPAEAAHAAGGDNLLLAFAAQALASLGPSFLGGVRAPFAVPAFDFLRGAGYAVSDAPPAGILPTPRDERERAYAAAVASAPLAQTSGLAAHWTFNEGAGASAADSTGNGNTGTVSGASWSAGKVGTGALSFDGVDDRVSVTHTAGLSDVTNTFTVAFWVNPQATHQIDAQTASGTGGVSGQRYAFWPRNGENGWGAGHAGAGVSVGTNGVSVYEHADGYLPALLVHQATLSGWTHVAVVYENRQPRLYLNGTLVKTGLTGTKGFVHAQTIDLGGQVYGYFDGLMDDVRVYDRVLSAAEIASLTSLARVNVALASNGGAAAASSAYDATRPALAAINGDRTGLGGSADPAAGNWWTDATQNAYPDWIEVAFVRAEAISEIDVYTLQDSYQTAQEPTAEMTTSVYGLTNFRVQYWDGFEWKEVPDGIVTGNNKVWRRFSFAAPVTTKKIRVEATGALGGHSRVVEVEAWSAAPWAASGTGLTGYYFDNADFTNHKLTRTDAEVDFAWDLAAPTSVVGAEEFSVRWTGLVVPRHTETYTFHTTTDDGVRLWVDGRLVIDRWQDQGRTEWSGQVALVARRSYDIRMEFYDRWHGAFATLSWSSPSQPKEVVPQSRLFPCWRTADQFVKDFYLGALGRQPAAAELQDWADRLGRATDFAALEGEARSLGVALFASMDYANRNRTAREFVYDLYWSYLQRGPDQAGWDSLTAQVAAAGREGVREIVAGSGEFAEKLRRLCGSPASDPKEGSWGSDFAAARVEPANRAGGTDAYSRNFNWGLPLVSLPGRAGLDLGLSLSYNSLVWMKEGGGITFDADRGFPSPGFRLGFPSIQPRFYNPRVQQPGQSARYSYLLITPSGARVELRQKAGTPGVYESADSSYLQLTEQGGSLLLRSADGTRLTFSLLGGEYKCAEVKDPNGNYITVDYDFDGQLAGATDTLGRAVSFNYDSNRNLISISQMWRRPDGTGSDPHTYATFGYKSLTLQPAFSNLSVVGAAPGLTIPVVERVGLDDGSYYKFDYTAWGQVWKITRYAADSVTASGAPNDSHPLSAVEYNVAGWGDTAGTAQTDCPRFTERRDWAENWNGDDGNKVVADAEKAVTSYSAWAPGLASCQVTLPDRTTVLKETYGAGWSEGLTTQSEVYVLPSAGASLPTKPRKETETTWAQDDQSLPYAENPRVVETKVTDYPRAILPEGPPPPPVTRKTRVEYLTGAESPFRLPRKIYEYQSDAETEWRRTEISYLADSITAASITAPGSYTQLRIIGLVSERRLYGLDPHPPFPEKLLSKVTYTYDEGGGHLVSPINTSGAPVNPVRHDAAYGTSYLKRGLVTGVRRWDVEAPADSAKSVESGAGYNTAGALVFTTDASGHKARVGYYDSFSDGVNRSTYAYRTSTTDPDQSALAQPKRATITYDFDRGLVTGTKDLKESEQTFTYDSANRLKEVTALFNGAKTRYEYPASMNYVQTYSKVEADKAEGYSWQVFDGAGRVIAAASDHPDVVRTAVRYSGRETFYDVMGRAFKQSNPTEIDGAWTPRGDDVAGWRHTTQLLDWQGRPVRVTNPDGTSRDFLYSGCGCAGGLTAVARDEVGRRRKIMTDILGRVTAVQDLTIQAKTEALSFKEDGSDVHRTTATVYNMRDQAVETQVHAGAVQPDATNIRKTTRAYDGHGRLRSEHRPGQDAGRATVYEYNPDDTVKSVTDARGTKALLTYNGRHLVTFIDYNVAGVIAGQDVAAAADVTYEYDAAGNRTEMTTAGGTGGSVTYTYDTLSRLTSEERQFPGLAGTYTLAYEYTLWGQVKKVTDQTSGTSFSYEFDAVGRLIGVNGAGLGAATLASKAQYRAWGAPKRAEYGNGISVSLSYNSRGLVTSYALGGVKDPTTGAVRPDGADFQYYADGRVKFASDLLSRSKGSGTHDRAYSYDLVGRLKEAYSGAEARDFVAGTNSGAQDGPYRQTYTHDVWDNLTSRAGRYWSEGDTNTDSYGANGHNPQWTYDSDGRLVSMNEEAPNDLPFVPARHKFDAAGRLAVTTQTTSRRLPINQAIWTTALTVTDTYDGDGMQVKRVRVSQVNSNAPTTGTTFYLRSSVLGGRLITEYNAQGARRDSYVYAGAEVLARQSAADTATPRLAWQHHNPVTGDGRETDSAGEVTAETRPDPGGVDVGDSDPFATEEAGDLGGGESSTQRAIDAMVASLIPGYGGKKCKLNGFLLGCGFVAPSVASGLAGPVTYSPVVPIYSRSLGVYVGLAVYSEAVAAAGVAILGPGSLGYLPLGSNYQAGVGITFPDWFGDLYNGGADPFGRPDVNRNFLSERAAQIIGYVNGWAGQAAQAPAPQPPPIPALPAGTDKDKVKAFEKAFRELLERLAKKNSCANLFGGLTAAYNALSNAQFDFKDLGGPVLDRDTGEVSVSGAQVNRTTTPPTVEINSQGPFLLQTMFVPGKTGTTTLDFGTGLRGADFGAIILLHELGHLAGIFGPDRGNQKLNKSHTDQVLKACFN